MPERLDDWRAARRGFGPEDLCRINPRLIYVDVNAYGFQGPWAERRGWEQLVQAATGLAVQHSAKLEKSALIPAYFNDYGSGCLGALGVLAALLRRADEGGSWLVRVSLAKTAMLGARFADNHEPAEPITDAELDRYLVDQESPIGLLTRIAPAVGLDRTPAYVDRAGSAPRSRRPGGTGYAARRGVSRFHTLLRPFTSASISSSLCSGVGVSRNRSVPRGTVG